MGSASDAAPTAPISVARFQNTKTASPVAQNASLALMFERVRPAEYGQVSALWNLAFDAGVGLGAFGFGAVVGLTGYPGGFLLAAAVVAGTLWLAVSDRRASADESGSLRKRAD